MNLSLPLKHKEGKREQEESQWMLMDKKKTLKEMIRMAKNRTEWMLTGKHLKR